MFVLLLFTHVLKHGRSLCADDTNDDASINMSLISRVCPQAHVSRMVDIAQE